MPQFQDFRSELLEDIWPACQNEEQMAEEACCCIPARQENIQQLILEPPFWIPRLCERIQEDVSRICIVWLRLSFLPGCPLLALLYCFLNVLANKSMHELDIVAVFLSGKEPSKSAELELVSLER